MITTDSNESTIPKAIYPIVLAIEVHSDSSPIAATNLTPFRTIITTPKIIVNLRSNLVMLSKKELDGLRSCRLHPAAVQPALSPIELSTAPLMTHSFLKSNSIHQPKIYDQTDFLSLPTLITLPRSTDGSNHFCSKSPACTTAVLMTRLVTITMIFLKLEEIMLVGLSRKI